MKESFGILANRLTIGFTFAFIYQIVIAIATSVFSLPLTGNVQDLISGIEKIDSENGLLFIIWWIISTIIITTIALLIVKNKKYLSPYKKEKDIEIPTKITAITAITIGATLSFLFFLIDSIIGLFVKVGSKTDVQAIYEAALSGDFVPLAISIIFSIIAGFIVLGVASKTARVKKITEDMGFSRIPGVRNLLTRTSKQETTTADTIGLQPGALVHVGKKKVDKVSFSVIEYDEKTFDEKQVQSSDECFITKEKQSTFWINVSGIHDAKIIEKFGKHFDLHPLVQADIMNSSLRPKIDVYDDYIFMILKMPGFDKESDDLLIEQISIVVGKNFVLTFQETEGDIFDPIRERLRKSIGKIRVKKGDYLTYAITDTIIDYFYAILETISEQTEVIERELMSKPTSKTLHSIHLLKRHMVILRKTIWPIRQVIDSLERTTSPLVDESTRTYLRDVYNHSIQVMDTIESLREMIGGMLDTYLSSLSNKMNEVMKTLTVIASIFIPITFIAGIYGTNFQYIPELAWEGSYFAMIGVMIMISLIMLSWFKKKEWV